jgi:phage gp37-like protein
MIAATENAILDRLRVAGTSGVLGYRYGTLDSYPEDWDEYLKEKGEWTSPAAFVVFAGCDRATRGPANETRWPANFFLVVAAENIRNETARRHGGKRSDGTPHPAEPGSYQLMLDAVALLAWSDLGLPLNAPLSVGAARLVRTPAQIAKRNVSMYAIALATEFDVPSVVDVADAPVPFTAFHVNWDIPPFGNVDAAPGTPGVQIPADATADATDHLELPQ